MKTKIITAMGALLLASSLFGHSTNNDRPHYVYENYGAYKSNHNKMHDSHKKYRHAYGRDDRMVYNKMQKRPMHLTCNPDVRVHRDEKIIAGLIALTILHSMH